MSKLIHPNGNQLLVRNLLTNEYEKLPFVPQNSNSFEDAQRRARERERQILDAIEGPLGRELSTDEIHDRCVEAVEDRDQIAQQRDRDWTPVLRTKKTNLDRLAEQLPEEDDSWRGKSRHANIRDDIERMQDQELAETHAAEAATQHARKFADQMQTLNALEDGSRWVDSEPASYRECLRKAKLQLAEPDGDPAVTRKLLQDVENYVEQRKQERLDFLSRQQEYLQKNIAAIRSEHISLVKDDVQLTEPAENLSAKFDEYGLTREDQQRRFRDAKKWGRSDEHAVVYSHTGSLPEETEPLEG